MALGLLAGRIGAIVGAFLWAGITKLTGFQIGYMAIGVGFLVGFTVRFGGRGRSPKYGIAGAVLALAACLVGNFLMLLILGAEYSEGEVSFWELLQYFLANPSEIIRVMSETFDPIDLLFYGLAV